LIFDGGEQYQRGVADGGLGIEAGRQKTRGQWRVEIGADVSGAGDDLLGRRVEVGDGGVSERKSVDGVDGGASGDLGDEGALRE
jgi:hypothetical protein